MPKIRGVKPELWTDENFVELSPFARLLWIGLWNHACDNGHLQDKSKQIKMRVLPTDDVNAAELLREIEGQGLIERAEGWITIPNLSHHQKPHKRWFVVCEKPGCEHPEGTSYGFDKPKKANPEPESTVEQPLLNDETASHNGGSTADGDVDCEVDGDGDLKVTTTPSRDESLETDPLDRFDEFWDVYAKKVDRRKAEGKWRLALKRVGVTPDLLIESARAYVTWERANNEGGRFVMDPARWLNGHRWEDERPARPAAATQHQGRASQWLQLAADLGEQQPNNIRAIGPRQ